MEAKTKEVQIYTAVFELAKKGKDLSSLKVIEIAEEANMGKGTLYEYFSSKEEILAKTIEYFFLLEVENMQLLLESDISFVVKLEKILWSIVEGNHKYTPLEVIFTNSSKVNKCLTEASRKQFNSIMDQVNNIFGRLIELGISEKIFDSNEDLDYVHFKLLSSFGGFMLCAKQSDNPIGDENVRKAIKNAVKLIVAK